MCQALLTKKIKKMFDINQQSEYIWYHIGPKVKIFHYYSVIRERINKKKRKIGRLEVAAIGRVPTGGYGAHPLVYDPNLRIL